MTQLNMTAVWEVGIIVIAIGLFGIYSAHKGWLKYAAELCSQSKMSLGCMAYHPLSFRDSIK